MREAERLSCSALVLRGSTVMAFAGPLRFYGARGTGRIVSAHRKRVRLATEGNPAAYEVFLYASSNRQRPSGKKLATLDQQLSRPVAVRK
jgi:hypothetical protein